MDAVAKLRQRPELSIRQTRALGAQAVGFAPGQHRERKTEGKWKHVHGVSFQLRP
jgi:hypothetical protein